MTDLHPGSPVFYRRRARMRSGSESWLPAVVIRVFSAKASIYLWNHRLDAPDIKTVALTSLSARQGTVEKLDRLKIKGAAK